VAVSVAAGDFNPDMSPVLDIPTRQVGERSLHDWERSCCGCGLAFLHEEALHVVEVTLTLHGESQAVDELPQEVLVEVFVRPDDVLHGLRGQGPLLDLGDERSLGGMTPNPSDEVLEDPSASRSGLSWILCWTSLTVKGPGLGMAVLYLWSLLDGSAEDTLEEAGELFKGLMETWNIVGMLQERSGWSSSSVPPLFYVAPEGGLTSGMWR
jgi:hypothetical protein